jgi:Polyketide cyclase / dehydrase and lipid transport
MATIIRDAIIDQDADTCWDALRDFAALHQRLAPGFIADNQMESSDVRVVTFFNGAVARERLVGVDDTARRLAYTVIESRFNAAHHNAAAQVVDLGDGRSRFVWIVDVLPDELAAPIGQLMDAGLAAIGTTLSRGHAA